MSAIVKLSLQLLVLIAAAFPVALDVAVLVLATAADNFDLDVVGDGGAIVVAGPVVVIASAFSRC